MQFCTMFISAPELLRLGTSPLWEDYVAHKMLMETTTFNATTGKLSSHAFMFVFLFNFFPWYDGVTFMQKVQFWFFLSPPAHCL